MSIDTNSEDWRLFEEFLKARLQEMRIQNDDPMEKEDTDILKGQIKFAKELLGLSEKKETPDVPSQSYL